MSEIAVIARCRWTKAIVDASDEQSKLLAFRHFGVDWDLNKTDSEWDIKGLKRSRAQIRELDT